MNSQLVDHKQKIRLFFAMLLASIIILRLAWIGDDIFITFRAILNTLHGYGPVYNIGERVQPFTHPLWFILLTIVTAITGKFGLSILLLSLLGSLSGLYLLLILTKSQPNKQIGLFIIALLSKAFLDYTTSGLENPLLYLLLAAFMLQIVHHERQLVTHVIPLSLTLFFIYLARPDAILLPLPFWMMTWFQQPRKQKWQMLLAWVIPLIIWLALCTFYYGFPFPNTAYAKIYGDFPRWQYLARSLSYLEYSFHLDPITPTTIFLTIFLGWMQPGFVRKCSFGLILHMMYVIWIGGDFMVGRMLANPFWWSVLILSQAKSQRLSIKGLFSILLFLGCAHLGSTWFSSLKAYSKVFLDGIADERAYHLKTNGLWSDNSYFFPKLKPWIYHDIHGVKVACGMLGRIGIMNGPDEMIIDQCGLTDAFLVRMPAQIINKDEPWRIGHIMHQIPRGYLKSARDNQDELVNPQWRACYDQLYLITHGPLWSKKRLRAIVDFQLDSWMGKSPCHPNTIP